MRIYIHQMEVLSDVIKAIELAQKVGHRPLQIQILQGCVQTLQNYITPEISNHTDYPEAVPDIETTSTRTGNRYLQFVSTISPHLRRLYPGRQPKHIITEAAKLWKLYKHLSDPEEIVTRAQAHAAREAGDQPPMLSISIPEESDCAFQVY